MSEGQMKKQDLWKGHWARRTERSTDWILWENWYWNKPWEADFITVSLP